MSALWTFLWTSVWTSLAHSGRMRTNQTPTTSPSTPSQPATTETQPAPVVTPSYSATTVIAGERLVLTVTEAGELLGISRAFAYELVARGELPVIRLGRRIVVPKAASPRDGRPRPRRPTEPDSSPEAPMLSIGKMVAGAEDYYLTMVARAERSTTPVPARLPGTWLGTRDRRLWPSGEVAPEDLRAILAGISPHNGAAARPAGWTRPDGWPAST